MRLLKVIVVFMYFKIVELVCEGIPYVAKYIWKEWLEAVIIPVAAFCSVFYILGSITFLVVSYVHEATVFEIVAYYDYSIQMCIILFGVAHFGFIIAGLSLYYGITDGLIGCLWPKTVKLMQDNWQKASLQVAKWENS